MKRKGSVWQWSLKHPGGSGSWTPGSHLCKDGRSEWTRGWETPHVCLMLHTLQSPQEESRRMGWASVPVGMGGRVAECQERLLEVGSGFHPPVVQLPGADILSRHMTTLCLQDEQ